MWNSSSSVLLQARLRVISDCSMYFAYEPQTQICTVHNGPFDKDHGLVYFLFSSETLHINYFLDHVKVIVVVVYCTLKMVVGMQLV